MIGTMRRNFNYGRFYPKVAGRLQAFAWHLPFYPDVLAMGVRDYADAWTSARDYAAQKGGEAREMKEVHRAKLAELKRGWVDVVRAAKAAWPGSGMVLWRQEDLHDASAQITATLLGCPPDQLSMPSEPVNALRAQGNAMFSSAERELMSKQYMKDVVRLHRPDMGVRWAAEARL